MSSQEARRRRTRILPQEVKMVFTQEKEVSPEPELGPGWRKMEVKVDNRVMKTRSKYWNPEGEELSYKEVKKLLDSKKTADSEGQEVKKRKSGPRPSAELESPTKKTHLVVTKERRASMVTKEKAEIMAAREKSSKKVRTCEKHQVVFKSREEETSHMKEFHKKRSTGDENSGKVPRDAVQKVDKKTRESVSDDILAGHARPIQQIGETSVMQQDEVQAKYSHLLVTVVPPAPPPGPSVLGPSSRGVKCVQSRIPPSVLGPSSRDVKSIQNRIPPPGPTSTARAPPPGPAELAIIRCDLCEFTAKSRKRLKKHMESHVIMPEVESKEVEEGLGNLSIDGVFENFSGDDVYDEFNDARVVDVEDEFDDVEEVGMHFSGRSIAEHNSYNGSDNEGGEVEEDRRSPEEITLASETEEEPEEITLDEGDDEEGGELEKPKRVEDKAKEDEEELAKLEEMDGLLRKSEFVEQMMESGSMLARFTSNCWFAAPSRWKPSSGQEVWHGTVGQIEDHYGITHLGVKVEGVKTQEQFMRVVRPLLVEHNQVSWGPALYRLAKALWFKHLDPKIPQALDKGVEEEEEYDEYDENLYEDYEDTETEREGGLVDGEERRGEAAAHEDEEYVEESVVPSPNQAAGGYVYETVAGQEAGSGEYVYEADEEGEDWEGDEEEGDYEDYGEVHAEYEGVYQGQYFDGVNQGGYFGGVNQAEYYARANGFDDTSNLYEDVY